MMMNPLPQPGIYASFKLIIWFVNKDDLVCTWSKMIGLHNQLPRILPEILKFRLSLHMVKDDWPPPKLTAHDLTRNFKV